jgi:hypothetical protein
VRVVHFLKRLLFREPAPPLTTRLTEAQAIAIARRAASNHWLLDSLNIATPQRSGNGSVVWHVETAGIGSYLRVVIDDVSGTVLEQSSFEGR